MMLFTASGITLLICMGHALFVGESFPPNNCKQFVWEKGLQLEKTVSPCAVNDLP
jgi:hypothetical protein